MLSPPDRTGDRAGPHLTSVSPAIAVADNGMRIDMDAPDNRRQAELFALIAGSATRPGIPAALWLGARGPDTSRPRANRRKLRQLLAKWLG